MSEDKDHMSPDQDSMPQADDPNQVPGASSHPQRKRVRVKVKKRIRIKQKPNSKKKFKKIGERALWTLIIVGFVVSLIIMVMELDMRDERFKAKQKAASAKPK